MAGKKRSMSIGADICDVRKEWDDALCPICMEHPHNAVLLLCASHAKGCRSYICDTSYRHSNCLDRFRKLKSESSNSSPETPAPINLQGGSDASVLQPSLSFGNELPIFHGIHNRNEGIRQTRESRNSAEYAVSQEVSERHDFDSVRERSEQDELAKKASLKCPLCRGDVLGWTVVEEARSHLNKKSRSCTRESCTFAGNYCELRRHARTVHPRVRPAEVDLSRQRAWRRFEHQREHEDIVSAIRSAMPGAVVFGDYVIDDSDRIPAQRDHRTSDDATGSLWHTVFFIEMLESMRDMGGSRRPTMRNRRLAGGSSRQRYLWGENLLGLQDDGGDGDDSFTEDDEMHVFERGSSSVPRQRRRLAHSRSRRDRS